MCTCSYKQVDLSISLIVCSFLWGCGSMFSNCEVTGDTLIKEGTYGVQKANELFVWNSGIEWVKAGNISSWTWKGINYNDPQEIKAEEFALTLWTKEHSWEEIKNNPDLEFIYTPGDPEIDAQLIANAERDNLTSPFDCPLTYRLEGLKRFTISCDQALGGQDASTDLTDMFDVFSNTLIINSDKQYLGRCKKFTPIGDYLGLNPLVFDSLTIVFKRSDIPSEKIDNCIFTIDLELDNGKKLTAQSKAVTFI